MNDPALREKLIQWSDPLGTAAALRGRSGLDALRALQSGEVAPPPIMKLFGFQMKEVEPGKASISLVIDESHYNLLGMVHGGVMATLLDTAMGCAVHTMLPEGRGYTTLNIGVSYIRPILLATGTVYAEGTIVHSGRSTAVAHGRVTDASGKLYASGETTCLLFDIPPARPAADPQVAS